MQLNLKLGKRAPRLDNRNLKLSNYLDMKALPPAPAVRYWSSKVAAWPMMLNDTIGDCTCAAMGHQIMAWTANATTLFTPANNSILTAYEAVSGYTPGNPSTDQGADMGTVLKYMMKTGIAGHKIAGYMAINQTMPTGGPLQELLQVINLFGGAYIGLALPLSAQNQVTPGGEWTVPSYGPQQDGSPGSWGGHAVVALSYNKYGVVCPTWNMTMLLSWNFLAAYCDEAYAVLSTDWLMSDQEAPSGFDLSQLQMDIKAVSAAA